MAESGWDANALVDFMNAGGNILIGSSGPSTPTLREILKNFGMEALEGELQDHFKFRGTHDTFYAQFHEDRKLLYKGIGHRLDSVNPLVFPLVLAPETVVADKNQAAGQDICLVSALQARNNARLVFVGSMDWMSNKSWKENGKITEDVTQWVFQESGVVRVKSIHHHKLGEDKQRDLYRIKDDFVSLYLILRYVSNITKGL